MKYKIIAIEREYASGGSEIGKRLAERLGIPCYGQEILQEVARLRGTTPEQIAHMEESSTTSFLYTIAQAAWMAAGNDSGLSQESKLYLEEAKVIHEMAEKGGCIFVGRCAGRVLQDRKDVLKVYIYADRAFRLQRAVEVYHDPAEAAEQILRRCDKRRNGFYTANTGQRWDDKEGYHLMLDSGKLGIETCVDIISGAISGAVSKRD